MGRIGTGSKQLKISKTPVGHAATMTLPVPNRVGLVPQTLRLDCATPDAPRDVCSSVFLLSLKVRILTFGGGWWEKSYLWRSWKVNFYLWRNWRVKKLPSRRPARECFEFVRMVFGGQFLKEIVRKRHCDLKIFEPAAGYPKGRNFVSAHWRCSKILQ